MAETPSPSAPSKIFLSYAREDTREIALRLCNDLTKAGQSVWLDTAEIPAGVSWSRDIETAIENCAILIALLTPGSYVSDICRSEQLRALRKGKQVIPVLLQADADRPIHLENLTYLDFSDAFLYEEIFTGLLTYLTTGEMPAGGVAGGSESNAMASLLPPKEKTGPMPTLSLRKRDSRAFRRYLTDLRDEPWLKDRHWWTYFLFHYADVREVVKILNSEKILPPPVPKRRDRFSRKVKLTFRPRTPDLFGCEGIRPEEDRSAKHCPMPIYLLFDLEALITMPDVRFSEGDVSQVKKTFTAAASFRDMPFDLIYHDRAFHQDEREEILLARRAQVFIPNSLDLTHLQHIWCRSAAEQETLRELLTPEAWKTWRSKITAREDYDLFNRKWTYVRKATLSANGALFQFHPDSNGSTFALRAEITTDSAKEQVIDEDDFSPVDDYALDLTALSIDEGGYRIRLYLDDILAYAGYCPPG
jgi:hypothetical protein